MTTDLRFPVGTYTKPTSLSPDARRTALDVIAKGPSRLREAVRGLSEAQLDTPYRPEGWTVRQVVHHVPDSHLNAYIRVKLALTEDVPTVKPYDEAAWAKLEDSRSTPIEVSLALFEAVTDRWMRVLRAMSPSDFARKLNHPENGPMTLDDVVAMYAWHTNHHVAHITELRKRSGWA